MPPQFIPSFLIFRSPFSFPQSFADRNGSFRGGPRGFAANRSVGGRGAKLVCFINVLYFLIFYCITMYYYMLLFSFQSIFLWLYCDLLLDIGSYDQHIIYNSLWFISVCWCFPQRTIYYCIMYFLSRINILCRYLLPMYYLKLCYSSLFYVSVYYQRIIYYWATTHLKGRMAELPLSFPTFQMVSGKCVGSFFKVLFPMFGPPPFYQNASNSWWSVGPLLYSWVVRIDERPLPF